jgi:hypothetical protein
VRRTPPGRRRERPSPDRPSHPSSCSTPAEGYAASLSSSARRIRACGGTLMRQLLPADAKDSSRPPLLPTLARLSGREKGARSWRAGSTPEPDCVVAGRHARNNERQPSHRWMGETERSEQHYARIMGRTRRPLDPRRARQSHRNEIDAHTGKRRVATRR